MILDMDNAWLGLVNDLVLNGERSAPRGRETIELLGHQLVVDMARPVLTVAKRRLGYRFMAAEAAWMLAGDDRVAPVAPYSKRIADFSDDGVTFFGAYGPKLRGQLEHVVGALTRDQDTRQAVINIWRENPPNSKDLPCHLSCQFMVRDRQLHCFATMRSSDAWLGVVYDVPNFAMWSAYVLLSLGDRGLSLGRLYNTAASRHLYAENLEGAQACLANPAPAFGYASFDPWQFKSPDGLIEHLWALARQERPLRPWLKELPE